MPGRLGRCFVQNAGFFEQLLDSVGWLCALADPCQNLFFIQL